MSTIPVNVPELVRIIADAKESGENLALTKPEGLEENAIYLGVLTARKIKPLSRLEYSISSGAQNVLDSLGLIITPVTRVIQNQTQVTHLILGTSPELIEQYKAEFDGTLIQEGIPSIIRLEAEYFGYPLCCAESYTKKQNRSPEQMDEEYAILFHRPCWRCSRTAQLLPFYRSALKEARQIYERLLLS